MEEEKSKIDTLFGHIREYVEQRIKLVNLDVHYKTSKAVSGMASVFAILLLGIFVLLFLSLALSWWIGNELNAISLGFLIVGGIYFFIVMVVYINRDKWITLPVINSFLKNIADEED